MGYSRGVAKLSNGDIRHLLFNNTSDVIASDLYMSSDIDLNPIRKPLQLPLSSQPRLAWILIDYGNGLSWKAWISNDATKVLTNLSKDQSVDFDLNFSYGKDNAGVVHIFEEFSGFGYSYAQCFCNHVGDTSIISMSEAEGRLCLGCLNNYLSRN